MEAENPQDAAVDEARAQWDDICADYRSGGDKYQRSCGYGMYSKYHLYTKYADVDAYLEDTVYAPKGENVLAAASKEYFEQLKEYPDEFLGVPFVLIGFDVKPNNEYIYVDDEYLQTEVVVYDLRDNVHSPNVIDGNEYYLYVIFEGTYVDYSGDIALAFSLLSLEKCG